EKNAGRGPAAAARGRGPAAERRRPLREVSLPLPRRPGVRDGPDPAAPPEVERVCLLPGRVRARLLVLRDRPRRLPPQPRAVGDRRAGPDGSPRGTRAAGDRRRLPGSGRALPELRERDAPGRRPPPSLPPP